MFEAKPGVRLLCNQVDQVDQVDLPDICCAGGACRVLGLDPGAVWWPRLEVVTPSLGKWRIAGCAACARSLRLARNEIGPSGAEAWATVETC